MSIIDNLTFENGNATMNEIRDTLRRAFGARSCPTQEQLQGRLNRLIAEDLCVKDGARHDGAHYALTPKGKYKLAQCRRQQARAA